MLNIFIIFDNGAFFTIIDIHSAGLSLLGALGQIFSGLLFQNEKMHHPQKASTGCIYSIILHVHLSDIVG